MLLEEVSRNETLTHARHLWGYEVSLSGIDSTTGKVFYEHSTG
jgi:stage V sporulation protein R